MRKLNWNCEDMQWKSNNINTTYVTFGTLNNKNIDVPDVKNGNPKFINILFLLVLCLSKFVWRKFKQRHLDWLCKTEQFHQASPKTSGCYSWCPGCQHSCCLNSLPLKAVHSRSLCSMSHRWKNSTVLRSVSKKRQSQMQLTFCV